MDCRRAEALIAETAFLGHPPARELRDHIRGCWECADYARQCGIARETLTRLKSLPVPDEAREGLMKAVRAAAASGRGSGPAPAVAVPEQGGARRWLIFLGGLAVLAAMAFLLILATRDEEAAQPIASLTWTHGSVRFRIPGMSEGAPIRAGTDLLVGTSVEVEGGGLARVEGDGYQCLVDENADVTVQAPRSIRLYAGRLFLDVLAKQGEPLRVDSRNGNILCNGGKLSLEVGVRRQMVFCVEGEAEVGPEPDTERLRLSAGDCVMMVEGEVVGPVRAVPPGYATHWLHVFDESSDGSPMSLREVAALPVQGSAPVLPDAVRADSLDLRVLSGGGVAVVVARTRLTNEGDVAWNGSVSLGDLLFPRPLAATGPEISELGPGESLIAESAALCLLRSRQGFYPLAIGPSGWTTQPIGEVDLVVRASESVEEVACPTHPLKDAAEGLAGYRWEGTEVSPNAPILLDFRSGEDSVVGGVGLHTDQGLRYLAGWSPAGVTEAWLKVGDCVFVGLDATGDFSATGAVWAHLFLDKVMRYLPPGLLSAAVGYGGDPMVEPTGLGVHSGDKADAMLIALWKLQAEKEGNFADFAEFTVRLAAGAESRSLVFLVTGPDSMPDMDALGEIMGAGDVHVGIVRIGTPGPTHWWTHPEDERIVVMDFSERIVPWAAALDVVSGLRWIQYTQAKADVVDGRASVLPDTVGLEGQPIAALLTPPAGADALEGRFTASRNSKKLSTEFALSPDSAVVLDGPLADRLWRSLQGLDE